MPVFRKITSAGWFGRGLLAALAIGVLATAGTTLAVASHAARSSQAHSRKGHPANPRTAFAVLSHRTARAAGAGSAMFPPGAVLAAVVGSRNVYVWELSSGQPNGPSPGSRPATTTEVCVGWEAPGEGGSGDCGPASQLDERGSVDIGRVFDRTTGTLSPTTVTVLVPNGVQNVTFTDRGGVTYDAKVTNNVVVVEDGNLAPPPAAAVSYQLPNGTTEAVPMPASPSGP